MKSEELIKIRNELKLSQEKFAKELGVSPRTIWAYENDEVAIPKTVKIVSRLLLLLNEYGFFVK